LITSAAIADWPKAIASTPASKNAVLIWIRSECHLPKFVLDLGETATTIYQMF
jgi:hypothetical protein